MCFFFQAEDGIRDKLVTGVQTCALPILPGTRARLKDIVKGYEYEKGRFVVVTDEDFERAGVAGTHTIEIRDFVPAGDIDFAYFEMPYWLVPDGPGRKAYALLREALEESGRVGIGTIVIRERERLPALRPAAPGLMRTPIPFAP